MLHRPARLVLLFVLLVSLALPVLARGGGGGGGRSSSGGSRSSSSYSSSSRSYGGGASGGALGIVGAIFTVVFVGGILAVIMVARKAMRGVQGGVTGLLGQMPALLQGKPSERTAGALEAIRSSDASFSEEILVRSARAAFERLQGAWASGTMRGCEGLMTPELQAEWEGRLDALKARQRRNCLEGLQITAASVVDAEVAAGRESVSVRFAARVVDYVLDARDRVVDGSRSPRGFVEVWRFTRREPSTCAGCGQPPVPGEACPACGVVTGLDGCGWRFEKIEASVG